MKWQVEFTKKAKKQIDSLDPSIFAVLSLLIEDLQEYGPAIYFLAKLWKTAWQSD